MSSEKMEKINPLKKIENSLTKEQSFKIDEVFKDNPEIGTLFENNEKLFQEYLNDIFPESKVKDIVYHSTATLFENYDIEKGDLGMHFSTKNVSSGILYSKYTKANLINIKNPLYFTDFGGFHFRMFGEKFVDANIINKDEFSMIDKMNLSVKEEDKLLRELLLSRGYDGIIYLNRREGINGGILNGDEFYKDKNLNDKEFKEKYPDASDSYIVFESEQIHIIDSQEDLKQAKEWLKNKKL